MDSISGNQTMSRRGLVRLFLLFGFALSLATLRPSLAPAQYSWERVADFFDPRKGSGIEGACASLIDGKIHVSHGFRGQDTNLLSIYDIETDTWTHGGPAAPDASVLRAEMASGTALDRHYALGGRTPSAENEEFDPATSSWSTRAPMSVARGGFGAASSGNKIYAVGGREGGSFGGGPILVTNEVYDPLTDAWAPLAPLQVPVSDNYATVAFRGKVYVFGGATPPASLVTDIVQIYDIVTDTWSFGAPMPTARGAAMAGVLDGKIFVFGGYDGTSNLAVTEIYDPVRDSWSPGPDMVVPVSEIAQGRTFDQRAIYSIGSGIFGPSEMVVQVLRSEFTQSLVLFKRGDADGNGDLNLTDAVFVLLFLFQGGDPPTCFDAADADDNGDLNLTDAIYTLLHLFRGGEPPPSPFPECSVESTKDRLACESFEYCETAETMINSLGMRLVTIPPGDFLMGSPPEEPGMDPSESLHRVSLTRRLRMSTTEVTQGQYLQVMDINPSFFNGVDGFGNDWGVDLDRPVEHVSWLDAMEFCRRLSNREGRTYRLPTEAEWEYACRAGTTGPFSFGDAANCPMTSCEECPAVDERLWWCGNTGFCCVPPLGTPPVGIQKVGQMEPNLWGLHDLHGNAYEWCQDWYGDYPGKEVLDPQGPEKGTRKVLRGGDFAETLAHCRSAHRESETPDRPTALRFERYFGFRVVLDLTDADNDGIRDEKDTCPESDTRKTVIIGDCDTAVSNRLLEDGCTIADLIAACLEGAENVNDFVFCVVELVGRLRNEGILEADEPGALVKCAREMGEL